MEFLKQFARLFGFKNQQVETLTEVTISGIKVRVWRHADTLLDAKIFPHGDYQTLLERVCAGRPKTQWAETIAGMPSVACVAIVDPDGNGVSVYPDWH